MEEQELQQLLDKFSSGIATAEEIKRLDKWYDSVQGEDSSLSKEFVQQVTSEIYVDLKSHIGSSDPSYNQTGSKVGYLRPYYKWAAAIVLIISGITFFKYLNPSTSRLTKNIEKPHLINDFAPGGNQATLTLGNGSTLVLNKEKNGTLTRQGKTLVSKKSNGLLVYQSNTNSKNNAVAEVSFNTLTTPRGGQIEVVLPDGSKVWLNAASSLKYPTAFTGRERNVELKGEAYFEVAKNKNSPFLVKCSNQLVQVLGTHFNINNYADEPQTKTTLLEGSVKATAGKESVLLIPGQQAVLTNTGQSGKIKVIKAIDIDEVMAWKNGNFQFNNTGVKSVLRQISRWYDVDVEYSGNIPDDHFKGTFSRNVNASNVLKVLQVSGINFKIEGRKIIVK